MRLSAGKSDYYSTEESVSVAHFKAFIVAPRVHMRDETNRGSELETGPFIVGVIMLVLLLTLTTNEVMHECLTHSPTRHPA